MSAVSQSPLSSYFRPSLFILFIYIIFYVFWLPCILVLYWSLRPCPLGWPIWTYSLGHQHMTLYPPTNRWSLKFWSWLNLLSQTSLRRKEQLVFPGTPGSSTFTLKLCLHFLTATTTDYLLSMEEIKPSQQIPEPAHLSPALTPSLTILYKVPTNHTSPSLFYPYQSTWLSTVGSLLMDCLLLPEVSILKARTLSIFFMSVSLPSGRKPSQSRCPLHILKEWMKAVCSE